MDTVLIWLGNHWAELLAAFGVGSGGGLAAKKIADKKQDAQIATLEKNVLFMDKEITQLKNDVKTNTAFDKQFRDQVEREHSTFKEDMKEVKGRLDQILNHLLSNK